MGFLDKLERRIGRYAIKRLIFYIVVTSAAVFVLDFVLDIGDQPLSWRLMFTPQTALREGEVWRFITFIFVPQGGGLIFGLIHLYFMYFVGTYLERSWSAFRVNLYILLGMVSTVAVSLVFGTPATGAFISTSLLLAFAALEPEFRIMLFFFIPIKVKWLGWFAGAMIAYNFITADFWGVRFGALAEVVNFLIFFGPSFVRTARYNRASYMSRQQFEDAKYGRERQTGKVLNWRPAPKSDAARVRHTCEECGANENTHPDYEFRYCSRCVGDHEFCMNCLSKHTHRTS